MRHLTTIMLSGKERVMIYTALSCLKKMWKENGVASEIGKITRLESKMVEAYMKSIGKRPETLKDLAKGTGEKAEQAREILHLNKKADRR